MIMCCDCGTSSRVVLIVCIVGIVTMCWGEVLQKFREWRGSRDNGVFSGFGIKWRFKSRVFNNANLKLVIVPKIKGEIGLWEIGRWRLETWINGKGMESMRDNDWKIRGQNLVGDLLELEEKDDEEEKQRRKEWRR